MSSKSELNLKIVRNQKFPIIFETENIEYAINYKPKDSDRFLVTYPKCGTSWTQQIIRLLITSGQLNKGDQSFFDNYFLEMVGKDLWKSQSPEDRNVFVIKTHLNYELLPYNPNAKYLIVLRNPKDVCVSLYHHMYDSDSFCPNFHDFFQHFIRGDVIYGDYFQYVKQYWIHNKTNEQNFTILIYEQMQRTLSDSIRKIAEFLGPQYLDRLYRNNERLMDEIIENSSFERMHAFHKDDWHFRKGIVGDWKSYFTKEESDLVDLKVKQVFTGTGLEFLWTEDMEW